MSDETPMGRLIQIDEARIRDHLGEMVRGKRAFYRTGCARGWPRRRVTRAPAGSSDRLD